MTKPILGPVLYYDVLRTARRGRFVWLRTAYALGLFATFLMVFGDSPAMTSPRFSPTDLSQYATRFFYGFLVFQFIFAALLTPSFVAGAIAEEKQKRSVEFLLTTDLSSHEIVLSKLLSRVASLLLLLLTGFPVMSLVQLFGGVDPGLLWSAFFATGITILSIASLSILISVYSRKSQIAIGWTMSVILLYFGLYFVLMVMLELVRANYTAPGFRSDTANIPWWYKTLGAFVEVWGSGHPFHAVLNYTSLFLIGSQTSILTGVSLANTRIQVLLNYCLFHAILALICTILSVWRLRPVCLSHAFNFVRSAQSTAGRRAARRRPVGDRPMLWKVLYFEYRTSSWMSRIMFVIILISCLSPAAIIIYIYFSFSDYNTDSLSNSLSAYIQIIAPLLYMFCAFTNATRAASSVGIERDHQTLDSLLVTPLQLKEILWAKWVGAWWGARPLLALLAVCWLVTLACDGSSAVACLLSWVIFVAYGSMGASVGLFLGARSTVTSRAAGAAAVVTIILLGGYWLGLGPLLAFSTSIERELYSFLVAATPLMSMVYLTTIGTADSAFRREEDAFLNAAGIVVSVLLASLLAWALWRAALAAYRKNCGRMESSARQPKSSTSLPALLSRNLQTLAS
jgi:ABC-type transport system involved in multi-copper enzyme maturation permease subunit